ncbi:MAG: GTPase Era [Alphaproteobacteria bacterium]|nr:GTPase Era [Alphaproteobacteria bacterium]
MSAENTQARCGFIAVIGLPNAGKSTLINALVGSKVSIVSPKAQTTRSRVLGIIVQEGAQLILVDTPGIFETPRKAMERAMVGAAYEALEEADAILHIVDVSLEKAPARNKALIEKLPKGKKVFLALNKIDNASGPHLLECAKAMNAAFPYEATFMISALKGKGTKDVLAHLCKTLPEGPWLFDEDEITDMPMRIMAAEITREKVFNQLHQELPQSTMVLTEEWEDFGNGRVNIHQVITVQRDSQKAIVLGKGGARIKQIGQEARLEMEKLFETRIHLTLFVKVEKDWQERTENLRLMGLIE